MRQASDVFDYFDNDQKSAAPADTLALRSSWVEQTARHYLRGLRLFPEQTSAAIVFVDFNPRRLAMVSTARETGSLIGSDKVEGTAVYGPDDQKIGSIERVMIDKKSGRVSYAVLSFGGFLGIGDDYYPLPWQSLKYYTNLGGYRTGITQKQLEGAPRYGNDNTWNWADESRARSVNDYYGIPYVA